MFALAIGYISREFEPRERIKNIRFVFRLGARHISVFYAHDERATGVFCEKICEFSIYFFFLFR